MEIAYVLCFIAGWFFCKVMMAIKSYHVLKKFDKEINERIESIRERIIPSRIEEENGMLYLYNKDTNEFLGQGKTFVDLEKNVREKFPNKLFNVPQEELNKYE